MRVYISGKIGEEVLSKATRRKFARAEEMLKAKGYEVFNPTTSGLGALAEEMVRIERQNGRETTWYNEILKLDLTELSFCDAIYMLKDWNKSPGARAEHVAARAMNKKIFFRDESQARLHLSSVWTEENDVTGMEDDDMLHFIKEYTDKHINEVWLPL